MIQFDFDKINPQDYNDINTKNMTCYNDIVKSLKIVEKFIIKKQLILTGGQAMHYALILKGHKGLYCSEEFPDYDCLSVNHQTDAFELSEQLCKANIPFTNAIPGLHITTMRTRVYLCMEAMDVTYIPQKIFNILKKYTLSYKNNLKLIHPHFQILDHHRSLSLPFENEPMYSIDHRWKKDMCRYDLLYHYYPLKSTKKIKLKIVTFSRIITKNTCISGIIALAYWINKAIKLKLNIGNIIPLDFDCTDKHIKCKYPAFSHYNLILFSDNYKNIIKLVNKKDIKYYESLLGRMPRRIEISDKQYIITIYDNIGQLLSCHNDTHSNMCIANMQSVMLYLLERYMFSSIFNITAKEREYYKILYIWSVSLVNITSTQYAKETNISIKNELKLFLPASITYGKLNISNSIEFNKQNLKHKFGDGPNVKLLKPKPGYPDLEKNNCVIIPEFNPKESALFAITGNEISSF